MTKISRSPSRGSFSVERYKQLVAENPDNETAQGMIDLYGDWHVQQLLREETDEWKQNNMEYDLRSTDWILEKVRNSDVYAQNLYAVMCNRDFQRLDTWPILKGEKWSCSWRHAGGIIADMQEKGDYIDWYCSGIRNLNEDEYESMTPEERASYDDRKGYVPEGTATDEIREDLKRLGWDVLDDE